MTYNLMFFNSVFSSIANGFGKLNSQIIFYTIGAVIKIPLAFLLVKLTGSWFGVPIANFFAMIPYVLVQPFYIRSMFVKIANKNE